MPHCPHPNATSFNWKSRGHYRWDKIDNPHFPQLGPHVCEQCKRYAVGRDSNGKYKTSLLHTSHQLRIREQTPIWGYGRE